jgi:4-hydroxy-2-oxoheptanedioate aldolase
MVLGTVHKRPDEIDLRWVPGVLSRNGEIEETGVAAGVLGHPPRASRGSRTSSTSTARLEAGEIILAGSFTRPMWVSRGDEVRATMGRWESSNAASSEPDVPRPPGRARRPAIGMWACTGSPLVTEIAAGSGLDWLLIDGARRTPGHAAGAAAGVAAYRSAARARAGGTTRHIKQVLDLGAQNILVPMVSSADEAAAAVAATRYPPAGVRGVGSALARGPLEPRRRYLANAAHVSVTVQIETAAASMRAAEIAAVDGVDAVFVGPSDLAASLGLLGQQTHPDVIAAVEQVFAAVTAAGKPVGVNAFDPAVAQSYIEAVRTSSSSGGCRPARPRVRPSRPGGSRAPTTRSGRRTDAILASVKVTSPKRVRATLGPCSAPSPATSSSTSRRRRTSSSRSPSPTPAPRHPSPSAPPSTARGAAAHPDRCRRTTAPRDRAAGAPDRRLRGDDRRRSPASGHRPGDETELLVYGRPSHYAESDALAPTAAAEFGGIDDPRDVLLAVSSWVGTRLSYVSGSSLPTDGATRPPRAPRCAETTATCASRCCAPSASRRGSSRSRAGPRADGFHAVAEAWVDGRWNVVDATTPRPAAPSSASRRGGMPRTRHS